MADFKNGLPFVDKKPSVHRHRSFMSLMCRFLEVANLF